MITKLVLKNFRGYKDMTLQFGPHLNIIKGKNGVGKSTINDAISFVLSGTDSRGSRNSDHLISFGAEDCEVSVVRSNLDKNVWGSDRAAIIRKKRRGQPASIIFARPGLPDIRMNQTELSQQLVGSFEVFSSCYNVGYFMSLDAKKQMEVVGQVAQVDRKALLASLLPKETTGYPSCIRFENLKADEKKVGDERRAISNQLMADRGALSQLEVQIKDLKEDLAQFDVSELQSELEPLQAQASLLAIFKQEMDQYKVLFAKAQEIEASNARKLSEQMRLNMELKALGNNPSQSYDELKTKMDGLSKNIEALKKDFEPMPLAPALPESLTEMSCIRCGQIVPEKIKQNLQAERERILNEYNEKCRRVADKNQNTQQSLDALSKKYDSLVSKSAELYKASVQWEAKVSSIQESLKRIVLHEVRYPAPPTRPEGDEQAILARIEELKGKLYAAKMVGGSKKELLMKRKGELESSIREKTLKVEELQMFENALKRLPEAELSLMLDKLSGPNSKFNYMNEEVVVKDYRDIPYHALSTGERMKTDLEIAHTLQKLCSGSKAPGFYFADNADLMDSYEKYLPQGSQVLVAKVEPDANEVFVVQL